MYTGLLIHILLLSFIFLPARTTTTTTTNTFKQIWLISRPLPKYLNRFSSIRSKCSLCWFLTHYILSVSFKTLRIIYICNHVSLVTNFHMPWPNDSVTVGRTWYVLYFWSGLMKKWFGKSRRSQDGFTTGLLMPSPVHTCRYLITWKDFICYFPPMDLSLHRKMREEKQTKHTARGNVTQLSRKPGSHQAACQDKLSVDRELECF